MNGPFLEGLSVHLHKRDDVDTMRKYIKCVIKLPQPLVEVTVFTKYGGPGTRKCSRFN